MEDLDILIWNADISEEFLCTMRSLSFIRTHTNCFTNQISNYGQF